MKRDTSCTKFTAIFSPSLSILLGMSAGNCQRSLVDASGMIRTQMGTNNRSEVSSVYETPFVLQQYCTRRKEKSEVKITTYLWEKFVSHFI
jgi:hypothetical protein